MSAPPDNSLFDRLVAESRLSPLFAVNALQRACTRAGVDASSLSLQDLRAALPEIQRTLETFLDASAGDALARIAALAQESTD